MHAPPFLTELAIVLGVAVLAGAVLSRLRLPVLTGFIAAGALVGPFGLRLVGDVERIQAMAEVGVVLLLFTIGLEFSLDRLRRLWQPIAIGGGLQVALTTAAVVGVGVAAGFPTRQAVFFGFLVTLSSTAIVLRGLADRGETDAPHGRLVVGTLLFQDLCVVPMMLVVPMLGGAEGGLTAIGGALARATGILAIVVVVGRLVAPRALGLVATGRRRELFIMAVLAFCTGIAWLTSLAGLSLALGAFLAGIALSDSEYGHQALADVIPFRDTFASLFFVSVGMLLDVDVVLRQPLAVLGFFAAVLAGKTLIAAVGALAMRFPPRVAVTAGVGLAQIGEFSFVLMGVGASAGLLGDEQGRLFVGVSVLTMMVTPLLLRVGPHLAAGAARLRGLEGFLGAGGIESVGPGGAPLERHVIIAGYGPAGQLLAEALRETGIPYLVIELSPENVRAARARGEEVYYGDATSAEILELAGIRRARELVLLINDPEALRLVIATARRLAPDVPIRARARYVATAPRLREAGATDVVTEEFDAAIEVLARVLRDAGVPRNVILERIDKARHESSVISRPVTVPRRMLGEIHELADLKIDTFLVRASDWASGVTIAEFHLLIAGAAIVLALRRDGATLPSPRAFETLKPGDVLYLVGERSGIHAAMELLERGPA